MKEGEIMTKSTEEMILNELFNLNHKIDKFQDEVREKMVTKEEFKREMDKMATKEELQKVKEELKSERATKGELQKVKEELKSERATKEDISKMVTKEEFKTEIDLQANDISQILDDIVKSFQNREKQLELRLLK